MIDRARDAALRTDANAHLADQLRSAQWFAQAPDRSPQIDLLLLRAREQRVDRQQRGTDAGSQDVHDEFLQSVGS